MPDGFEGLGNLPASTVSSADGFVEAVVGEDLESLRLDPTWLRTTAPARVEESVREAVNAALAAQRAKVEEKVREVLVPEADLNRIQREHEHDLQALLERMGLS